MMQLIDIHVHPHRVPHLFPGGGEVYTARDAADCLVALMDHTDVQISGILGRVHPFQSAEEVRRGNDFTVGMVRQHPDRLYGMAFMNPLLPVAFVEEELDRLLRLPEIRGIKLEIDVNCRDLRVDPVMKKAREYGVPVLHHCWYMSFWNAPAETAYWQRGRSEPHDVANLAERFPDVQIIMAHLDGCGLRGVQDVADFPNVWVDTSGGQPCTGVLEYAVKYLGAERLLFGTDRPGRGFESQLARVLGAAVPDHAKQAILAGNARRLFQFGEVPSPLLS